MPKIKDGVPELNDSKILELVRRSANDGKTSSALDFERFARYYKLFRNKQTNKNYTGLANLFVPEPYRIVRKKTAKLANAIKKIKVTAESQNDIESAKTNTHLLNFLRRKLNWFLTERSAIQESRIVGLSWLKVLWLVDKEEEKKPWKGFDVSMETADKVLLAPGTTMADVFEGHLKWLVHEYETDIETLRNNPNYKEIDLDLLEQRGGAKMEESSLAQAREIFQSGQKKGVKKKSHKIQEYWGKYTVKDKEGDYLCVVADEAIVLRKDTNPYEEILDNPIPFVPIVANMIGNEMYPVGDIEPAESLFNELNDTRNQRMDTVTLNIDPAKEIVRGANIDKNQLVARRGWVIESNIPGGIRFIPPDMQGVAAAVNEEKIIRGDIQQVTGALDFSQDSNVQAGVSIDTAKGAIIAKSEADEQTADDIEVLKVSLRMLYRTVLAYAQNFLDRSFTMRVVEQGQEQFKPVDSQSIQGNLDLDIEMETLQDTTTKQQINLLLLNQARTIPGSNIGRFFIDTIESIKGLDNINIQEYYQDPGPASPPPPSVSISLRGELNPLQTGDIAIQAGVQESSNDPILNKDLRELMRGNLPEDVDKQDKQVETLQKQMDILNSLEDKDENKKELAD